jgi:anti-sigma regulatory factor (Ser/Thr protein kinase)
MVECVAGMRDSAVITIPSDPKYLSVVRAVATTMAGICGMGDSAIEDVKLAVDEACANVIRHAYGGDTNCTIVVKFKVREKGFEVVIEDSGVKARPDLIAGRNLDDVRPGGLGIHLIKRAFDLFQFDEKKKKGNRLRLVRRIGGGQ